MKTHEVLESELRFTPYEVKQVTSSFQAFINEYSRFYAGKSKRRRRSRPTRKGKSSRQPTCRFLRPKRRKS